MALKKACRHGVPAGGSCFGCEYDEIDYAKQEKDLATSTLSELKKYDDTIDYTGNDYYDEDNY